MARVLVTGATGFVGGHLLARLREEGIPVRAAYRGRRPAERQGVEWTPIEALGPGQDWSEALEGCDAVIHLAALAHQIGARDEDLEAAFLRVNTEGSRELARAAATSPGMRRFVFISSIGAMATLSERPLDSGSPCAPDSAYGRSKLAAESAIREALQGSGVSLAVLRPCLVYGPGNPGNMARLERLLRLPVPLPLGGIANRRSFIYVENLVDAIVACLQRPTLPEGPLLMSDGDVLSTPDLMRLMGAALGRPARLFRAPAFLLRLAGRIGDAIRRVTGRSIGLDSGTVERLMGSLAVDGEETFRRLEWRPPFSTAEGIRRTFGRG